MNLAEGQSILGRIQEILTERRSQFVFESCHDRTLFPESVPTHRLGATMSRPYGQGTAGPGTYNISQPDYLRIKPTSTKGYSMGARTAKRLHSGHKGVIAPGPGTYECFVRNKKASCPDKKPFNMGSERIESTCRGPFGSSGVGTYDLRSPGRRRIPWQRDTMLKPIDLPQVDQLSTIPINTDKLPTTTECKRYQRKLAYLKLYF
ncbi:hypothetical protein EG68_11423 [Paragonimus skrjabini miyazakii]|uniref:Protein pitchfork n=1 Tax=Paragonimus skrjabini miyazakii TaxID=59628 RepID=A0A8S9YIQ4_9TREM|nr:hypothetical protein EG68_11423 [Paragonimus skrjabini miyazakii]